jgi:predicted ATPase
MIQWIRITNFKALRDATLQLGPFTLLVGPNGSGKSTALQALKMAAHHIFPLVDRIKTFDSNDAPRVEVKFATGPTKVVTFGPNPGIHWVPDNATQQQDLLMAARFYSLDAVRLANPVQLSPGLELGEDGSGLAAVLDQLRDRSPERFEALNTDLQQWLPEFDRVLFDTTGPAVRELLLRVAGTRNAVRAGELSHGTLFALALLTLAKLETPAPFIGIEEPDRGVHPRLLRRVQDAMYRLAFPKEYGERRPPVQVVATTHSPMLLDLFRDHPEQIVVSEKKNAGAEFSRLVERPDVDKLLGTAPLGELWYSGILGGVPSET